MILDSQRPLIITGMHRSGTSLIARFIHHSGIDLGDQMLGANSSNKYGHYEDLGVLSFHRMVLEREFGHQMWVPSSPKLSQEDYRTAKTLVIERDHKPYWGWKDPRTSLFLNFWSRILPDANYLFIVRHPDLVVDSLSRRNNTREFQFWRNNIFLQAWFLYNFECYQFFMKNEFRCVLIQLEMALESPEKFIRVLSEQLQYDFNLSLFITLYDESALTDQLDRRLFVSPIYQRRNLNLYHKMSRAAGI